MTTENNQCKSMSQVMAVLAEQGPSLKNVINLSSEPNPPNEPSWKISPTPNPSLGKNDDFRQRLFKLDESHHPRVSELSRAGEWFVRALRGADARPCALALCGSSGCGKTHTARRIHAFSQSYGTDILFRKGLDHWSSLWLDWPTIAESDDEDDFRDVLYQISSSSFFVVDDIGSESDRFKNGVVASRLRRVLSHLEKKWVVITCNGSLREFAETYDIRIADRLRAFHWVEMGDVPSYRPKLTFA